MVIAGGRLLAGITGRKINGGGPRTTERHARTVKDKSDEGRVARADLPSSNQWLCRTMPAHLAVERPCIGLLRPLRTCCPLRPRFVALRAAAAAAVARCSVLCQLPISEPAVRLGHNCTLRIVPIKARLVLTSDRLAFPPPTPYRTGGCWLGNLGGGHRKLHTTIRNAHQP
jgi:hypothetical protein